MSFSDEDCFDFDFDSYEPPCIGYKKSEFIETMTGNRVNRKSILCGSQNIRLVGKAIIHQNAVIRGDLANISFGRYAHIGENTVIRPSNKMFQGGMGYFPLMIGDNVTIESDCVVAAAAIGSHVHIGKGSIISRRCIIKDCSKIVSGTVLPPDTVVPPFTVFSGSPAHLQRELPESFQEARAQYCLSLYESMIPIN